SSRNVSTSRRACASSSVRPGSRRRGMTSANTTVMMSRTSESSMSVKPDVLQHGCRPRLSPPLSGRAVVDIGILAFAALLSVRAVRLDDEFLAVAEVDVRVAPGVYRGFVQITVGVAVARIRGTLHECLNPLARGGVEAVVELEQMERFFDALDIGHRLGAPR